VRESTGARPALSVRRARRAESWMSLASSSNFTALSPQSAARMAAPSLEGRAAVRLPRSTKRRSVPTNQIGLPVASYPRGWAITEARASIVDEAR
jgi:hypothetical protein